MQTELLLNFFVTIQVNHWGSLFYKDYHYIANLKKSR